MRNWLGVHLGDERLAVDLARVVDVVRCGRLQRWIDSDRVRGVVVHDGAPLFVLHPRLLVDSDVPGPDGPWVVVLEDPVLGRAGLAADAVRGPFVAPAPARGAALDALGVAWRVCRSGGRRAERDE
jgi:chemotaxis signal transduction protein